MCTRPDDAPLDGVLSLRCRPVVGRPEPAARRVDPCLATGLGILHSHHTDIREAELSRVGHHSGDHLVPVREHSHGAVPRSFVEEVGDHHGEPASRAGSGRALQSSRKVEPARALCICDRSKDGIQM